MNGAGAIFRREALEGHPDIGVCDPKAAPYEQLMRT